MSELTLLPPNATSLERALDQVSARIEQIPIPIRDLWNPEICPTEFLPWLAWSYSVDEWSSEWTEAQKRGAIANSIIVHKHKGTIGAIQDALGSIGIELSVMEWFNRIPIGDPYTFEVIIDAKTAPVSQQSLGSIARAINSTKNVRSKLSRITPGITTSSNLYIGEASCIGVDTTIQPAYSKDALHLLMEGAAHGFSEVENALDQLYELLHGILPFSWLIEDVKTGTVHIEKAVDDLHMLLNETMPAANYW